MNHTFMILNILKYILLFGLFGLIILCSVELQARGTSKTPSVPSGLAATNVTPNSISLKWNVAKDSRGGLGIKDYDISRNNTLIGTTSNLTFTDRYLNPSTLYQ